ncbi:MAG: hypothetical protein KDD01_09430 [Phaeodactylibacter sp.]|nr:hypothetical protein [Phaeodactylibacter sp.]
MQDRNFAWKMRRVFQIGTLCLLLSIPYCNPAFTEGDDPPPPPPPPPIVSVDFVEG